MKVFIVPLLASLVASAAIDGLPEGTSIRRSLPSNYTISEIKWTIPITNGGPNHTLYGTVQDVFAQINVLRAKQDLNPYADPLNETLPHINSANDDGDDALLERRTYSKTICNVGLSGPANYNRIEQGVTYLQKVKGRCGNGPGPGNCGRISCSYDAAIYWCNDNNYYVEYDCSSFAYYANWGAMYCSSDPGDPNSNTKTWGQVFDTENFNVLVGHDSC
ncbi:hypothetical protein F5Y16DRAFT_407446 [Xylariaceae sp. FL0255]|nr:hypothetical protein F5Y16DRAFT_407446 [Xylariaceae sp. FL0255]